jgi:tetratricopeptide (TPR) repeat protein
MLPLWLNEGIAEFMQNTEIKDKQVLLGEPSPDDILYMRQNSLIPLSVLFKVDEKSPYYHEEQKGSVFYAESWALTHYMMIQEHQTHSGGLDAYVHLVNNGQDSLTAAQQAFGDLKKLETALRAYIDHGEYKEFVLSSAAAPIDESGFKVRTLSPADADAFRADAMANSERSDDARALIDTVLKEDPNNIQARETLGYMSSRAGQLDDARKWYGEAVKLGSQNFLAYYYYATLTMGTDNDEAEKDLRAAIRLNPQFAPSYDRLAVILAMNREDLDEAHRMNLMAIELEPDNVGYRINAANVLEVMGNYTDALSVLKTAVRLERNEHDANLVQSYLQQVEHNQQSRAEAFAVEQQEDTQAQATTSQAVVEIAPKYPTITSNGPPLKANGVIEKVSCSYPTEIEFKVAGKNGATLALYNNDFTKIELTAEANVQVPQSVNPCHDFDGRTVRVQYLKSQSTGVDGQVMSIELMK